MTVEGRGVVMPTNGAAGACSGSTGLAKRREENGIGEERRGVRSEE
jgi:hypothetical protein